MSRFRDSETVRCIDDTLRDCLMDTFKIVCNGKVYSNVHGTFNKNTTEISDNRFDYETTITFFHSEAPITKEDRRKCRVYICDEGWFSMNKIETFSDGMSTATLSTCVHDKLCNADNKPLKSGKGRNRRSTRRSDSGNRESGGLRVVRRRHN